MRRRVFHPPHPFGDINVTPMIDVVMCLIVFYLIVGRLAAEQRVRLDLPRATAGARERLAAPLIVNVCAGSDGAARMLVDGAEVDGAALESLVRAARRGEAPIDAVVIRAQRDLAYAGVEPAVEACRRAGAGVVRLATEPGP